MDFSKDLVPAMNELFVGAEVGDKRVKTEGVNTLGGGLESNDQFVRGSFKDFF